MRSLLFLEKVLFVLGCIGIAIKYFWPGHNLEGLVFVLLGFVPLAALYFGLGLFLFRDHPTRANDRLVSALCGLAFSLGAIGITTRVLYWAGAESSLLLGMLLMATAVLISSRRRKPGIPEALQNYYRSIVSRSLVMISFSAILFAVPQSVLVRFEYRDDPVYAKLMADYYADPDNRAKYEAVANYEMRDPVTDKEKKNPKP